MSIRLNEVRPGGGTQRERIRRHGGKSMAEHEMPIKIHGAPSCAHDGEGGIQ
jgi:hypothetical protein